MTSGGDIWPGLPWAVQPQMRCNQVCQYFCTFSVARNTNGKNIDRSPLSSIESCYAAVNSRLYAWLHKLMHESLATSSNSANIFTKPCVIDSVTKGTSGSLSDSLRSLRSIFWPRLIFLTDLLQRNFLHFPTAQVSKGPTPHLISMSFCTSQKQDEFRLPCRIKARQETAQLAALTQSKAEVTVSSLVPAAQDSWHWPAPIG